MPDYTLYYWPLPFRGQFVRSVLAHAGASWEEKELEAIVELKSRAPSDQPVTHMGPPVLIDCETGFAISQMPAVLRYLGQKHSLVPETIQHQALTEKIIADANDVLYEMTRYNGNQMWTPEAWDAFQPRLTRWMALFEETGRRNGLERHSGTLLGTESPGLADLTAATLWGVMTTKFAELRPLFEETAPSIASLCDRIASLPAQADLRAKSDAAYGELWCGGDIEASLRAVL